MDITMLKEEIIEYSKEIGIDQIGFASADVFTELKARLHAREGLSYDSGFEKGSIEERTEPRRLMDGAESIISIALAYPSRIPSPPKSTKEERRGIFCRASWGMDYHHVLRDRLNKLMDFIQLKVPEVQYKIMVDTGELSDRAVAERAGIGFSGKNTFIITEKYGSFVYLGEVITNIPFVPDNPIEDSCGDCRICLDACPTGALVQPGQLNAQMCLAFQTQTKDFLPDVFREKIGTRLYGCDTCQAVCPRNKGIDFHLHEAFEPEPEVEKPLQRNAMIALAHYKDETSVDELIAVMTEDVRPVIRGTAAWSLGKIGTEKALAAIEDALEKETDDRVIVEMKKGLSLEKNALK